MTKRRRVSLISSQGISRILGAAYGKLRRQLNTPDVIMMGCPICFRVEENATTDGVQAAVVVLIAVTVVVLGAFARFVVGFVRRERDL